MNRCIRISKEVKEIIEELGFFPLFKNEIKGFSVEDLTGLDYWWSNDPVRDPWLWRVELAQSDNIVYGKFFNKKAGFISKEWFPSFANSRRDGYDFDSLYEDGLAKNRCKKLMDLFEQKPIISSVEMKDSAGFGKNGEKNFNGILTELQMLSYLMVQEFHKKKSKAGKEYGMDIGFYAKPETKWGYDYVTSCYSETSEESKARIIEYLRTKYPNDEMRSII